MPLLTDELPSNQEMNMYSYTVTFGNGSKVRIKADSPRSAWKIAETIGIVSSIKHNRIN